MKSQDCVIYFFFPHSSFLPSLPLLSLMLAPVPECLFVSDLEQLLMSRLVDFIYCKCAPCCYTVQFCPNGFVSADKVLRHKAHFLSSHVSFS